MNDFNRCNTLSGIYWLKEPVENIQITVKLKPRDGVISLPKFEDYTDQTNSASLNLENNIEECIFKWQEKAFSSWELQRYSDIHNCISDVELNYHDNIKSADKIPHKLFTYIHEDYHLPLPNEFKKNNSVLNLNLCLERFKLDEQVGKVFGGNSVSTRRLFRSEEFIHEENEQWTAMHVVFDNSKYNEDSQLLLKQEATLLSLYHNKEHNYLIISPNVNNLELNPYTVETASGVLLGYQYGIDVDFGSTVGGDELDSLLHKMLKKWEKQHKYLMNFVMPPLGKKQCHVTLEILTARGFDLDDIYIEFDIKVAETIQCNGDVHGRTHTSKAIRTDDIEEWSFGHVMELVLEYDAGLDPPPIQLFLEAISTDWWGRYRTEGYSYLALSLDPGRHMKQLSCSRPEEKNRVQAESRRFFVGGCHLIKDLDVLAKPQLEDTNFTYLTTGTIHLRWSTITQAHSSTSLSRPAALGSTSSASALLVGAEAALTEYKRARARLAAATRDLGADGDG